MNTLWRSDVFDRWLSDLADKVGKARMVQRLDSVAAGNVGDGEPVGEGVSERRIPVGPGYRLSYTQIHERVYLLLMGGDKSSQKRDIQRAIEMARAIQRSSS
jgi:putative addiction module killer protein